MPLKNYGVLKCQAMDSKPGMGRNPHYQVLVNDGKLRHRIAINVKSQLSPSELFYLVNDNFQHPITKGLEQLKLGFHPLDRKPGGLALDYIRGNLFDVKAMKPLPFNVPGPDNDLNELIEKFIFRAIATEDAVLYAFGEKWGEGEEDIADRYFGFKPGNGIHDIHMNQGNSGRFTKDNGVWQDGGLLIHFPSENQWVAVFLAFQSQAFHTNDSNGDPLDVPDSKPGEVEPSPDGVIRIIAALVNPLGSDVGKESVTLINTSPNKINLKGWALADQLKQKYPLDGISIEPGAFVTVPLSKKGIQLDNNGGIITLLNQAGLKIHGVSYTKEDADKQGWTIVF